MLLLRAAPRAPGRGRGEGSAAAFPGTVHPLAGAGREARAISQRPGGAWREHGGRRRFRRLGGVGGGNIFFYYGAADGESMGSHAPISTAGDNIF